MRKVVVFTVAVSLTGPQGPTGSSVVRVKVTLPAIESAALGQYDASTVFTFGLNVPEPEVDQ